MEIARHVPSPLLRPFLLGGIEGWAQTNGTMSKLREVPFPGIPLIFCLETAWRIEGPETVDDEESFVAGLHLAPTLVQPTAAAWACIELRLTPVAAHRILGVSMHELTNRTVAVADVLPEAREVSSRLREASSWADRFALVEDFLLRRLSRTEAPARQVEWSWHELRRSAGRAPIGDLAADLGWSHRRLIARYRQQIGLAPKAVARVMRFSSAVEALRSPSRELANVAYDCGYFDQPHLNREFRALSGTTPTAFRASLLQSGGVAA